MLGPQAFSSTTPNGGTKTNDTEETNDDEEGGEINLIQKLDDNIQSNPFAVVMFLNNDLSTVRNRSTFWLFRCNVNLTHILWNKIKFSHLLDGGRLTDNTDYRYTDQLIPLTDRLTDRPHWRITPSSIDIGKTAAMVSVRKLDRYLPPINIHQTQEGTFSSTKQLYYQSRIPLVIYNPGYFFIQQIIYPYTGSSQGDRRTYEGNQW